MEQIGQTPASCGVGSPFCPRLAPAPGKNTHHHFQIGGQEPLRVRHLHQDFTCRERERDGRGWKNPAAISWCARGGRAAACHRGRWAGVKVHQLSQGAALCTPGGWQPSSPGLSSSSSPRAPVIAWEIAGPVHSKVREGEKWFLKDGNFSCQGRMPRQGLVSMTKGPLQGYGCSKIHNKFDCHCLGRAWHCGTSFRGSVFHPPRTGEGPATEESQNLQDGKWESLTQLVGGGALQRLLPNLLNRLKIDFSCFG